MTRKPILWSTILLTTLLSFAALPAQAQDASDAEPKGSRWNVLLEGGVLLPLGELEAVNQSSLAGGIRVGKTTRYGLGLDVAAAYSPLSHKQVDGAARLESHYVTLAILPRFTLGSGTLRFWLAGGGGVAYERTLEFAGLDVQSRDNSVALVGVGSAGVEFHPTSGLGLAVVGTYNRTRGQFDYELVNLTAGLVLTFR